MNCWRDTVLLVCTKSCHWMFCQYCIKKKYTQHCGQSAKYFICYRWEGMSKKEMQFTSSLVSYDGQVESSSAALLALFGSPSPQASTFGLLCWTEELWLLLQRLEAALLMLSSSPALAQFRLHRDHMCHVRCECICQPLKKKEKKVVVCVFFTSALAQKKGIWGPDALGGKSWCWFLQVLQVKGLVQHIPWISDWWQGKFLLWSLAPSLAFFSLLSAATEPPNYCVEENIFLPLPELSIRCLQKPIFRSLQHFPLLHSITLWRNTRPGAEWRAFSGYQHDLQSKHKPCQLPWTKFIPAAASVTSLELLREEIWCLQPHNQMAAHEDALLITITEC